MINRGDPWKMRSGVVEMAAGFCADVPDLSLVCDAVRPAGHHVVYLWTFTGTHSQIGNPLKVAGWEEWDFDDDMKVKSSRGWLDAQDCERQAAGGWRGSSERSKIPRGSRKKSPGRCRGFIGLRCVAADQPPQLPPEPSADMTWPTMRDWTRGSLSMPT